MTVENKAIVLSKKYYASSYTDKHVFFFFSCYLFDYFYCLILVFIHCFVFYSGSIYFNVVSFKSVICHCLLSISYYHTFYFIVYFLYLLNAALPPLLWVKYIYIFLKVLYK